MGQALYRKYRSKKLSEIVGQKPIIDALSHALESGKISHAYLFTGPRGVGKTSIARILAHEINGIEYTSDELPIDIIEIDAASNRRIDEIRDLREKVRIAPISAKYKVYIIDEVHMLTKEAFNALLKTLEEPPAHVIFILATTESHKLPETIVSRTQRYSFKLASQQEVIDHLSSIAKTEKIDIDQEAIAILAAHSGGSLRDALSLLDQVRHSNNTITAESVRQNLGLPSQEHVVALIKAVSSNEPQKIIDSLSDATTNGVSASLLAEQCIALLRADLMQTKHVIDPHDSIQLIQQLLLVESSHKPEVQLELALIGAQLQTHATKHTVSAEAIANQPPLTISTPAKRTTTKHEPPKLVQDSKINTAKPENQNKTEDPKEQIKIPPTAKNTQNETSTVPTLELWDSVVQQIKLTHNTLYSILRMADCNLDALDQKQITLLFRFPFHQKRMNESKNKQVILDTFAKNGVTGYEIQCDLKPKDTTEVIRDNIVKNDTPAESNDTLDSIRSVFGGVEVLE